MSDQANQSGAHENAATTHGTVRGPQTVNVSMPVSVAKDIEKMQRVTKLILGKLGCLACHSGFDLRFIHELDFNVDEKLNVNGGKQF